MEPGRVREELIDETAAETFPASDAPAWTAAHAGAPLVPDRAPPDEATLHDGLRRDVEALSACDGPPAMEEYLAGALLDAGMPVLRGPLVAPRRARDVEGDLAGAVVDPCVVVGAHYGAKLGVESAAVLLAVARELAGARLRYPIRLVAFAEAVPERARASVRAPRCAAATYAERLRGAGIRVRAMVALGRLGFAPQRAPLAFVCDLRALPLGRAIAARFRAPSSVEARVLWRPRWLPSQRTSDAAPFRDAGWAALGVRGRLGFDGMSAAVPGLAAVVAQLAGGSLPAAAPSPA